MALQETISELATRSILLEVSCHPKPGLVTPYTTGCHGDMDYFLFLKSTAVLSQGFRSITEIGHGFDGPVSDLLRPIRTKGVEMEKRMFEVTNGINTQKGLVFLFCMLLGGAGRLIKSNNVACDNIVRTASEITSGIVEKELYPLTAKDLKSLSKGERIFVKHGLAGIRGEVERGLPSVMKKGLPEFTRTMEETNDINKSAIQALLSLMTTVEDTNIVSRAGIDVYNNVKNMAQLVLDNGGILTKKGSGGLDEMDNYFTRNNISPGGSADLLSATMFLYFVENELF